MNWSGRQDRESPPRRDRLSPSARERCRRARTWAPGPLSSRSPSVHAIAGARSRPCRWSSSPEPAACPEPFWPWISLSPLSNLRRMRGASRARMTQRIFSDEGIVASSKAGAIANAAFFCCHSRESGNDEQKNAMPTPCAIRLGSAARTCGVAAALPSGLPGDMLADRADPDHCRQTVADREDQPVPPGNPEIARFGDLCGGQEDRAQRGAERAGHEPG